MEGSQRESILRSIGPKIVLQQNSLDTGSQGVIVGFYEDRFDSTPDSGRG
jgi:hypothetical protein